MTSLRRRFRLTIPVLASVAALAAVPSGAVAAEGAECSPTQFDQVFADWNDSSQYVPVAGGSIEGSLGGWTLEGDARPVDGNQPYDLGTASGDTSLLLPSGSSVTTRNLCVSLVLPTMRFVASGSPDSVLKAELVRTTTGDAVTIGYVTGSGSWEPSQPLVLEDLPGTGSDTANLAFRFTPVTGSWRIDDVFVDPYRQR